MYILNISHSLFAVGLYSSLLHSSDLYSVESFSFYLIILSSGNIITSDHYYIVLIGKYEYVLYNCEP